MLRRLDCADEPAASVVRANARRLRAPGELKIALYQSQTAHAPALAHEADARRVVTDPDRLTIVQCVLVRRTGDILAGTSVSLLRLSAPIGREASCPLGARLASGRACCAPDDSCAPAFRSPSLVTLLAAAALSALGAAPALAADGITRGTTYKDAPDNRYLLGGHWLFRLDTQPASASTSASCARPTTAGWTQTTVPNAWNAGDNSIASMLGTVGWYRKDFRLPDKRSRMDWLVRFESVNYRSRVWLNGRPIGPQHRRAPALRRCACRASALKRQRHQPARHPRRQPPPADRLPAVRPDGLRRPRRRLVELRRPAARGLPAAHRPRRRLDASLVRPDLPCSTCAATVLMRVTVRNYARPRRRACSRRQLRHAARAPRHQARPVAPLRDLRRRVRVGTPQLWSPASPHLYNARLRVRIGGQKVVGYDAAQRHPLDQGRRRAA